MQNLQGLAQKGQIQGLSRQNSPAPDGQITKNRQKAKKEVMYAKNDILEVFWIDIFSGGTWLSEADALKRPEIDCQAIGYFLKQDDEGLYLSHMVGKDNERDQTVIPNGCIKEIKIWKTSLTKTS